MATRRNRKSNVRGKGRKSTFPSGLMRRARRAARNAYAPYSGFAVGAAVETVDGKVFSSTNMENASYGVTMCAEVGAIQAASAAGLLGKIRRIAIAGGPMTRGTSYESKAVPPCGRCRQLLAEAAQVGGRDIDVRYSDLEGKDTHHSKISALLPEAFSLKGVK